MLKLNNFKVIGLVGALAIMLTACSTSQKQNNPSGQDPTQNQTSETSNATQDEESSVVIIYSDSGFAPSTVNVKVGQKVVFKNTSSKAVQVNSDPHPAHSLYPELNIGAVGAGESKSLTFSSAGERKYHNHLKASENGSIIVK